RRIGCDVSESRREHDQPKNDPDRRHLLPCAAFRTRPSMAYRSRQFVIDQEPDRGPARFGRESQTGSEERREANKKTAKKVKERWPGCSEWCVDNTLIEHGRNFHKTG